MSALMRTVHADAVAPQPWRNGGGSTRELLAWPAGPDWRLRVSLADIERDGPFSSFPGVERWFTVVQGAGVRLALSGGVQTVRPVDAPLRFDGAEAPSCSLLDGPTRDLNLMARHGTGAMFAVRAGEAWSDGFEQRGLFTLCAGRLTIGMGASIGNNADTGNEGVSTGALVAPASMPALTPAREHRVGACTLLWNLGDGPCRFFPDEAGPCGWWLGFSEVNA